MQGLATAQRSYDRRLPEGGFHSEACRQEQISQLSSDIEQTIVANVMRDSGDALDVGANLIGFLSDDDAIKISRFIASGNREGLFQLMLAEYGASLKRTADDRATKQIEAGDN